MRGGRGVLAMDRVSMLQGEAIAALTAMTADVKAAQSALSAEATAPRDAGEPIMAIVSIKSQRVTFYDADGWILSAPVS
jgi:hypothetical protein